MHYGLLMMQERANLIGGNIILNSKIGKGTYIKGIFHYN
jgi:signal transduction histidine kinase